MFSLFPVVLEGLVGLLPSFSAPVQGERGLHLQHPSGVAGTKTAPRLFPEDTSDRNAAAVKSGSRTLKGARGEEEGAGQHKKHRLLAVPS